MNDPFSRPISSSKTAKVTGTLGEQLVAQWLRIQGWKILEHQYRCRWGEIDLIAINSDVNPSNTLGQIPTAPSPTLIFVEVKTRSRRNWDEEGLLAITPTKQAKLIKAAQLFLSDRPELADYWCRFDVALVRFTVSEAEPSDRLKQHQADLMTPGGFDSSVQFAQPVEKDGYQLILQNYIESAFDEQTNP